FALFPKEQDATAEPLTTARRRSLTADLRPKRPGWWTAWARRPEQVRRSLAGDAHADVHRHRSCLSPRCSCLQVPGFALVEPQNLSLTFYLQQRTGSSR